MIRKSTSKKQIKVTWRELKHFPFLSIALFIIATITAIGIAFMPFFITKIIDSAYAHDSKLVIRYVWIFAIVSVITPTSFLVEYYFEHKITFKLLYIYGSKYFENYMKETNAEFEMKSKGERWNDLSTNLRQLGSQYQIVIFQFYRVVILIIASFVGIALINAFLALILVTICILSKLILLIFDKKIRNSVTKQIDKRSEYNQKLDNLVNGVDTLFLYNKMSLLETQMQQASESIRESSVGVAKINSKFEFWRNILSLVFTTLLIGSIGFYILKVNLSEVALFIGVLLSAITFNQFLDTLVVWGLSLRSSLPLRQKKEYVQVKEIENIECSSFDFSEIIEAKNISFNYEEKNIIKNMNFNIKKNEKKAIIGPSGCGKSTLMKILLKQIKVKEGALNIDGNNINDLKESQLLNNISYANNQNLILQKSFKENMELFSKNPINFKTLKHIFNLNFIDNEEQILDPNKLSTGQKQRVNLARAWAMDKPILILDECFGNLDWKNANEILEKVLSDKSRTIILISHHLTPKQEELFDEIIKMKKIY